MMWLKIFSLFLLFQIGRYLFFAGGAYLFFWNWCIAFSLERKIQPAAFRRQDILREIKYSFITLIIFSAILAFPFHEEIRPLTKIYGGVGEYGVTWLALSLLLLIVFHDTYFYWMHRLMHQPKIFKLVHRVHHESRNPTPFAAFAFHPLEALIEFAWIVPLFFLVPLNQYIILAFSILALLMNVIGHLGLELYPESWKMHAFLKYLNRSTFHNDHHRFFKGNYSLYFTWWDKLMNTLNEKHD